MTLSVIDPVRRDQSNESSVSGRFLTGLLESLERQEISAINMIGDLPIPLDQSRITASRVDWPVFVEFMKRLEHALGGPSELEECGYWMGRMKRTTALRSLSGLSPSPISLYRTATRWALRRAIPDVETQFVVIGENQIDIQARLRDGMRGCPQFFHFATGAARALPHVLGLSDAIVEAEVGATQARYRLKLPPSPSLFARIRRSSRALLSAGSVLHVLEHHQLELQSDHDALRKAHCDLAESEDRYRAFANATVDILAEVDDEGRVIFVSAAIERLLGYTPEQVIGSHFRLWIRKEFHARANRFFRTVRAIPLGDTLPRTFVTLHSADGREIASELSVRSFENSAGEWRLACVVRDLTDSFFQSSSRSQIQDRDELPTPTHRITNTQDRLDQISHALASCEQRLTSRHFAANGTKAIHLPMHPLEQSLTRLLTILEKQAQNEGMEPSADLVSAADNMTRVVDSALIGADGESIQPAWIETEEFLDSLRLDLERESQERRVSIGQSVERLPLEIWAQRDLLVVGLSNLVRAARNAATTLSDIQLSIVAGPDTGLGASVEFVVDAIPSADTQPSGNPYRTANLSEASALSEAIAADIAKAHGGEVVVERHEGGYATWRMRIANPC